MKKNGNEEGNGIMNDLLGFEAGTNYPVRVNIHLFHLHDPLSKGTGKAAFCPEKR